MILMVILACILVAGLEVWLARDARRTAGLLQKIERGQKEVNNGLESLRRELYRIAADGREDHDSTRRLEGEMNRILYRLNDLESGVRNLSDLGRKVDRESIERKRLESSVEKAGRRTQDALQTVTRFVFGPLQKEEEKALDGTLRDAPMPGGVYGKDDSESEHIVAIFRTLLDVMGIGYRGESPLEPGSWFIRFYLTTGPEHTLRSLQSEMRAAVGVITQETGPANEKIRVLRDLSLTLWRASDVSVQVGPLVMVHKDRRLVCDVLELPDLRQLDFPRLLREPQTFIDRLAELAPARALELTPWAKDIAPPERPARPGPASPADQSPIEPPGGDPGAGPPRPRRPRGGRSDRG
jgi:hypothetical protein